MSKSLLNDGSVRITIPEVLRLILDFFQEKMHFILLSFKKIIILLQKHINGERFTCTLYTNIMCMHIIEN